MRRRDKLDQLLRLTERYCVVYQTIAKGPPVDIKMQARVISAHTNVSPSP